MIWADRVAIGLAIVVAFGFGVVFVSSDAALRLAEVRARAAKFDEACAQPARTAAGGASTAGQDVSAGSGGGEAAPPVSDADAPDPPKPGAEEAEATNPATAPRQASAEVAALPAQICFDMKLRDELESEEDSIVVPTMRGTLFQIGEAELFAVFPLWVGLRVLDAQTGGPQRRLARSPYWMATEGVRRQRRRRKRPLTEEP